MKDAHLAWSSAVRSPNTAVEVSVDFKRECVDFFAELSQVLGVPRSLGQIYGLLFASPRPLSFTDIVGQLGISKGSASQGLQLLRALGAVQNVRDVEGAAAPKSSGEGYREQFVPELGLRRLISGVLREKVEPLLGAGGARMRRLRECARQTPSASGAKFTFNRVKQLESWRRQLGFFLPLVKTLLVSGRS